MKPRSVSVNGRSADVTKKTRSDRGMNSAVIDFVLADDGVGSRGIDDADFPEQIDRRLDDEQIGLADGLLAVLAVFEHGNDGRRRRDAFLHERLARRAR